MAASDTVKIKGLSADDGPVTLTEPGQEPVEYAVTRGSVTVPAHLAAVVLARFEGSSLADPKDGDLLPGGNPAADTP